MAALCTELWIKCLGSSPSQDGRYCVRFLSLGSVLGSHTGSASLPPGVQMGTGKLNAMGEGEGGGLR